MSQKQKMKPMSAMTAASATAAIVDVISESAEAKTSLPYTTIEKLEVCLGCFLKDLSSNFLFQQHGIHINDIKKLRAHGFYTVESVAFAPRKELEKVNGIGEQKVEKIYVC